MNKLYSVSSDERMVNNYGWECFLFIFFSSHKRTPVAFVSILVILHCDLYWAITCCKSSLVHYCKIAATITAANLAQSPGPFPPIGIIFF